MLDFGFTHVSGTLSTYLWIALGSAAGGAARYFCSGYVGRHLGETFPWGTVLVNAAGCLLIGFFAALTAPEGRMFIPSHARQFVMVGLCGGFTTYSTFSLETLNLARNGEWGRALANVLGTLALCLAAVWLGYALSESLRER